MYYRNVLLGEVAVDKDSKKYIMKEARKYSTPEIDAWINGNILEQEKNFMVQSLKAFSKEVNDHVKKNKK